MKCLKNIFIYFLMVCVHFVGCNKNTQEPKKKLKTRKENSENKKKSNTIISIDDLVQEYIQGMGDMEKAWWGGHLEIGAIANCLDCVVKVWQTDNKNYKKVNSENPSSGSKEIINIYYNGTNHYQYFKEKDENIQKDKNHPEYIPGDGHCMFRSALSAKEEKLIKDDTKIADLRKKVAGYLQKNCVDIIKMIIELVLNADSDKTAEDSAQLFPHQFGQKLLNLYYEKKN